MHIDTLLTPHGLTVTALLLILAGLSDGIGTRAVVLLINRITPTAFVITLLASALLFAAGAVLWMWGAWVAATQLFGVHDTLINFVRLLSLAYAPFLLGALALLPMFGRGIRWLLRLWSFLAGVRLLMLLGLSLWQALLCALCGTVLVMAVEWLFSEPAAFVARRLWATLTGRPRPLRMHLPRVIPGYAPAHASTQTPAHAPVGTPHDETSR